MIYRDANIPAEYKYLAEVHDNYVVWANRNSMTSGSYYSVYYQFFYPSFIYFKSGSYQPRDYTQLTLIPAYDFGTGQLTNSRIVKTLNIGEVSSSEWTSSDYSRPDYPLIFIGQFLAVLIILWVFKQLSRLWFKGGMS